MLHDSEIDNYTLNSENESDIDIEDPDFVSESDINSSDSDPEDNAFMHGPSNNSARAFSN